MRKFCSQVSPIVVFFSLTPTAQFFYATFFSVVFFLLPAHATPTDWKSDKIAVQDSGAVLENGIIFNHVTKFLLATKKL